MNSWHHGLSLPRVPDSPRPHSQLVEGVTTQALFRVPPSAAITRPIQGFKKCKPVTTSLFWNTFPVFLKDWGTALTQALCHWNTLQAVTLLAPSHRAVTSRGTSAALGCSLGSAEPHLVTERNPPHSTAAAPAHQVLLLLSHSKGWASTACSLQTLWHSLLTPLFPT